MIEAMACGTLLSQEVSEIVEVGLPTLLSRVKRNSERDYKTLDRAQVRAGFLAALHRKSDG
jgi:hypothetical protein